MVPLIIIVIIIIVLDNSAIFKGASFFQLLVEMQLCKKIGLKKVGKLLSF